MQLSPNTQAILLLTAPLLAGRAEPAADLLTPAEYKRLAHLLREKQRQPADLLAAHAEELLDECQPLVEGDRLKRLLSRGFLLGQTIERWHSRAICVVSRADPEYPRRLKSRLKDDAPPVLYGCGEVKMLDSGGLAVVGSRDADDSSVLYTKVLGRLAASAGQTLVSGGARGIDQAAMRGALEAGGRSVGVLADSLERAAISRNNRDFLMDGRLTLVSTYDPLAGFNVGRAMQRNKLIYALASAALIVSSDFEKGGTWAGAVEQLEKLRLVPVYVRSNGRVSKGLEALRSKGASVWPEPSTPEALAEVLSREPARTAEPAQQILFSRYSEAGSMAEPRKRPFTRDEYHAMAEAGILKPEERLELIEGEIYRMGPIGSRHAGCVNRLVDELAPLVSEHRAVLSPRNPVNLTDISEPEPDITVLRPREDLYSESHPTPEDVLLLIEVADSSIGFDRGTKFPLYARCGIPEAWLVDLVKRTLEVHREPGRDGYRQVQRLRAGDRIAPLAFPDFEIAVASIIP